MNDIGSFFTPTNIYVIEGVVILFLFIWINIAKIGRKRVKKVIRKGCQRGKLKCISITKDKFVYESSDGLRGTLLLDDTLREKFKNMEKDKEFDFSYMILPGEKTISIVFNDDEDLDLDFEFLSTKLLRATRHSIEVARLVTFTIILIFVLINYFLGILPSFMMTSFDNIFKNF